MEILPACLSSKWSPCYLTARDMVFWALQLPNWFLVSLSQLAERALGWGWCGIQLEKQVLSTVLLSPFVIGWCSVTRDWEAGKEKNALKMTYCSPLFLIPCPWLCAASPLWVMSLPFSHHCPPLPFPIMAKSLDQPGSQAEWPHMSSCEQIGVPVLFLDIVEVLSSDFSDCCMVFFLCQRHHIAQQQRGQGKETQMVTICSSVFSFVFAFLQSLGHIGPAEPSCSPPRDPFIQLYENTFLCGQTVFSWLQLPPALLSFHCSHTKNLDQERPKPNKREDPVIGISFLSFSIPAFSLVASLLIPV